MILTEDLEILHSFAYAEMVWLSVAEPFLDTLWVFSSSLLTTLAAGSVKYK